MLTDFGTALVFFAGSTLVACSIGELAGAEWGCLSAGSLLLGYGYIYRSRIE